MNMKLHQIGIDIRHIGKFCIERPNGSGDFLFLIFQTKAMVVINKKEIEVHPDCCILYKKGEEQHYYSTTRTYVDSFLHFEGPEDQIQAFNIPFNEPFYLKNPPEIMNILKFITREQISDSFQKEENLNLLIRFFLAKIKDNYTKTPLTQKENQISGKLIEIRSQMYSNAALFNSVSQMAQSANVSLSHFKFLYTKHFGISCYDDLLTAKAMNAQHHLLNTDLSIKEIALLCGYQNDTSFMRSFKKRTGKTPSEFREGAVHIHQGQ
ncbi:MAG: helix-turn-helix domain-containing protein [Treponema sp.]|nr:helix-turn-helix domain-containing protein [Treponema sp.]